MSASVSPSIGSRFLICQQGQSVASSNMRLPSVNELFRMTDRISEHNRMFGHHNPPPVNTQKPSEGFIDLTSDSSQDTFHPSNFQRYPATSPSYPSHPVDPSFIDLEFLGMSRRRSREPTVARSRQHKRRRRNDSDDCLITISSPTDPSTTNSFSLPANPSNRIELDLRESFDHGEAAKNSVPNNSANYNTETGPLHKPEEEEDSNSKDEQDRQLADTIKAQAGVSQGASKLNQLTCIICMDNMTNMTATMCGHVFCHTCIMEALIAGENRTDGRPAPKCPMCRTRIRRKIVKGAPEVIPLNLKLMTRGKKTKEKQKQALS